MNSKIVITSVIAVSFVILFGSYFVISKISSSEVKVASYTSTDKERPIVKAKSTFYDMGKIKVSDEKTAEFSIKNVGTKPLQLSNISSSCGCTVGQISYQGKDSKEFGMHSVGSFDQAITPQTEAKVKVIYRPYVMPVYGNVEREVYITTNDPQNQKLVFKVKAFVQ